ADKAGLKAGDELIKIGDINITDFKDDAAELLKGANNTRVEVTFKRQGKTQTTTITREAIEIDAVPFYGMANEKTGYIVLSKFNAKATDQTKSALLDLKGQGMEQLILDLRGNPGGLLSEAIKITNLFVPKGETIVTTKSKVKKFNKEYRTKNNPVDAEIPLVVLVDGSSASASEIVSGSLQDLDRAVIIGARSFGKGLVQRPLRLTYGTQLKVTISRYYTASGRCIQALDYWNRDQEGNAVRNTEFQDFKTRNGRKVQDGGGVMPDVEIPELQSNALTKALSVNNVIFDFATDYYYQNSLDAVADFDFRNTDFEAFKNHVQESNFNFETTTEKALREAIADEDTALFGDGMAQNYRELMEKIKLEKINAIDRHKREIQKSLADEIIKRYFYRDGLYRYYLQNDGAISEAVSVLESPNRYSAILN
ncbi:MAG: PDZ domain-containing protein, partial [Eudoraea sp.]|nr:PDZ domain-containing protein [Eudoraea sp.]